MREYPSSGKAAVAIAALVSLWGVLEYSAFEAAFQRESRDPYKIAEQEARFERVRAATPHSAVLGYLTDLAPGNATADAMFGGAQYALAPRLLKRAPDLDMVLGNFTKPADFVALGRQHGLRLETDFGNGVVLFQRERR